MGKVWHQFEREKAQGVDYGEIMDHIGVKRYCCKRMLLTHQNVASQIVQYPFKDQSDGISNFNVKVEKERTVSCD